MLSRVFKREAKLSSRLLVEIGVVFLIAWLDWLSESMDFFAGIGRPLVAGTLASLLRGFNCLPTVEFRATLLVTVDADAGLLVIGLACG